MATIPQTLTPRRFSKASEALFEKYLESLELEYRYEPVINSRKKRLDFRVTIENRDIYFEVKSLLERPSRPPPTGAAWFDPFTPIRRRIEKAREQFQDYVRDCCVLVLHNHADWEFRDKPYIMFGAMLGDPGIRFPIELHGRSRKGRTENVFGPNGKMIRSGKIHENSARISAIAVLSEFTIPNLEFEREYQKRIAHISARDNQGISARLGVRITLYKTISHTLGTRTRLSIYDNPFATIHLSEDFKLGPYDTRYRWNKRSARIQRTGVGSELERLEEFKNADLLQKIDRFKDAVIKHFQPRRIIVFGSQAYGTSTRDSDVDLLVVFPGNRDESSRSLAIRQFVDSDFAMDLICYSEGQLNKRLITNDFFLQEIVNNGIVLYEAPGA